MSVKKRCETLFSFFKKKTKNDLSDDNMVDKDILDDPDSVTQDVIKSSAKISASFFYSI
jgi:hypothetical protein